MIVGIGELQAKRIELRHVAGQHVALLAVIGLDRFIDGRNADQRVGHAVGAEIIGEIELGRRAGLRADGFAAELKGGVDLGVAADQETLTVIVIDAGEQKRAFARHGPGRVAREHIDRARFQRLEAAPRIERRVGDFRRIVEDRRRKRAAEINVKARPVAGGVALRETLQALADAAGKRAAILDLLQRGLGRKRFLPSRRGRKRRR